MPDIVNPNKYESLPVLVKNTVSLLNEMLELDHEATEELFAREVEVSSKEMDNHPHLIVGGREDGSLFIGSLAVVNSILTSENSRYRIFRSHDDNGILQKFGVFDYGENS